MNNQTMNQTNNQNMAQYNQKLNTNINNSNNKNKKVMDKETSNNESFTENWMPVKSITNGIVYTKFGEMVTGIKIQPKNIFILEQSAVDNTLIGLMNFYNLIDFEFWLIVSDRPVDITVYQTELQLLYNQTQDPKIRKLIQQDMDKGDSFINNNIVDTEYFILFKDKNMDNLLKKVRNLINGLSGAGLIASQTSDDDLRVIIDNFLNGGKKYEAGTVMPL